jgi:hypothetical protein
LSSPQLTAVAFLFFGVKLELVDGLGCGVGFRWSAIASHLPRRTDNEIKNYWNTHLKKRLAQMGVDPVTHTTSSSAGLALSPLVSTQLAHSSQWHCALAEAEARLSRSAPNSLASTPAPHPSSLFMRSWKTNVLATLRPAFGTVKLEPTQKTRQDWSTALGTPIATTCPSQIRNASLDVLEELGIENHFSPTSILQGPDSDSCSGSGDDFDFLHQDQGSSYQSFPLIDEHADSASMEDDIPESFWQGAVQQAESLLEDLKTVGASEELELIIPLGFGPEF